MLTRLRTPSARYLRKRLPRVHIALLAVKMLWEARQKLEAA